MRALTNRNGAGTGPALLPYKITPIFDQNTLPAGLQREHCTKEGVWGLVRVIDGRLRLIYLDGTADALVTPDAPAVVRPEQRHLVKVLGPVRMQIEFYDRQFER